MPTQLAPAAHLEGFRSAMVAFVRYADRAGLQASVPTTPDWTVRQLIAHQGMVHRWAAAILKGGKGDPDAYEREGRSAIDPVEWLRDGAIELATAITTAPDDLDVLVFLNDAPPAKRFWTRRQCHETTMHAVDALSAALGRYPKAADTWITDEIALDGIDELLNGFLTRGKSSLRSEKPLRLAIKPKDVRRSWLVHVSGEPPVVERDSQERADLVLEATAESLYLALWNRTDEVQGKAYDFWRNTARVSWG